MPDTELAKSLQEAKKKPRNFALVAKGPNVVHLLVQKKPIPPGTLQKLKQEHGGKTVIKGVITGSDGPEMVFQVAEAAPVGEVKLRTYIIETAELHLKPRFEVVEGLQEIADDEAPPLKSGDGSALFQSRLKKLKPELKRVKNSDTAKEIDPLVAEMTQLAKNSRFDDALLNLDALEAIVRRGLENLQAQASRAVTKLTAGAKTALPEEEARELQARLDEALEKCPALLDHFAKTMGDGGASIYFSDVAKDAFYTSKGDKVRGIPDNVIILPKKGKTPLDLLDGLIFETCNAEIQQEYDQLTKEYLAALEEAPIDVLKFGAQKATIEAKCVLKNAQLLFQARKSKVDVAYQANRNLLAMLRTCLELEGKALANYDEIIQDPQRLSQYLTENEDKLGAFLESADKDAQVREAILTAMAATPHNRNATSPTEKNGLKTCDLYAYELLETAPGQVVQMLEHEIGKHIDLTTLPMDELRPWLTDRIGRYDGDDKSARQTMVLRVIDDLKRMFPALAESEFSSLAFSPDMQKMAEARMLDFKTKNAKKFNELKRDAIRKALDNVNGSLREGLSFLETFMDQVKKDTRPVLATLEGLASVAGIPAVAKTIRDSQTGDPPVLAARQAEAIFQALQEAVMAVLEPYNEHAMSIDVEEGSPASLKKGALGLANAVKGLPPKLARPMEMPLKLFLVAIGDLESL